MNNNNNNNKKNEEENDAEVNGMYIIGLGYGQDERDDDDQRRKHIDHTADRQQEEVEQNEEDESTADVAFYKGQQPVGHFGINEIIGVGHRRSEDDNNAPDQDHALAYYTRQLAWRDFAADAHFDHQDVKRAKGCGFADGDKPPVDTP